MRKLICGCACVIVSILANASDSNSDMAKVENYLEQGGDFYMVSDMQSWSDWRAKSLECVTGELKSMAEETPQMELQMILNLSAITIDEAYKAIGFDEITAHGASSKYVGSFEGQNLFRIKQTHQRIPVAETNNLYDAFVSDQRFKLAELAQLPAETDIYSVACVNGDMLSQVISSFTIAPMLMLGANEVLGGLAGCNTLELFSTLTGEFKSYIVDENQYYMLPDKNGTAWKAINNIATSPNLEGITIDIEPENITFISENCTFNAEKLNKGVMLSVISDAEQSLSGKSLGETAKFQQMVSYLDGVDSGNCIVYNSGEGVIGGSNMLVLADLAEDNNTAISITADPLSLSYKIISEVPNVACAGFFAWFATADFTVPESIEVDGQQIIIKDEE